MGLREIRTALRDEERREMERREKYSRKAVAAALGVSYNTYCTYEQNPKRMQVGTAEKLAGILGCSTADIFL